MEGVPKASDACRFSGRSHSRGCTDQLRDPRELVQTNRHVPVYAAQALALLRPRAIVR